MGIQDKLAQIDSAATQKAVEGKLRQYRTYMLTVPEEKMPSLTAHYTLEMPNYSNVKTSAVEDAAIENVDSDIQREKFFNWISMGMKRLTKMERKLIAFKYLQMEPMYNYDICAELNISESSFYRVRNQALYKLALSLRIEKYVDSEENE